MSAITDQPPAPFAFFDVDNTLLSIKSMFSFQDYYHRHCGGFPALFGPLRSARFNAGIHRYERTGKPREFINRKYYESFRGRSVAEVRDCARSWYADLRRRRDDLFIQPALMALRRHQKQGTEIVLVSGSSVEILTPLAEELDVAHMLATRVEQEDGRYTGVIRPPQTIGRGKAEAVRAFLEAHPCDAAACFAYGDHHSDIPMLEAVGRPCVVAGDPVLEAHAAARSWPVLRL